MHVVGYSTEEEFEEQLERRLRKRSRWDTLQRRSLRTARTKTEEKEVGGNIAHVCTVGKGGRWKYRTCMHSRWDTLQRRLRTARTNEKEVVEIAYMYARKEVGGNTHSMHRRVGYSTEEEFEEQLERRLRKKELDGTPLVWLLLRLTCATRCGVGCGITAGQARPCWLVFPPQLAEEERTGCLAVLAAAITTPAVTATAPPTPLPPEATQVGSDQRGWPRGNDPSAGDGAPAVVLLSTATPLPEVDTSCNRPDAVNKAAGDPRMSSGTDEEERGGCHHCGGHHDAM
ncbi:hypothetical protein PR048_014190 [Dryococelus australis]|uniref:Uncharacterized protein n=1 Tax=Dryococelus australis TaxID=614101 RepID=A0ABQ9HE99_9NEOP|nr:hypothetical protein PR048_014190 [Dryococelus australis]